MQLRIKSHSLTARSAGRTTSSSDGAQDPALWSSSHSRVTLFLVLPYESKRYLVPRCMYQSLWSLTEPNHEIAWGQRLCEL